MTDDDTSRAGSRRPPSDPGLPERSFLEFLPRRSLMRAVVMLLVLCGLVMLQRRSSSLVSGLTNILMPPAASRPLKATPAVGPTPGTEPSQRHRP